MSVETATTSADTSPPVATEPTAADKRRRRRRSIWRWLAYTALLLVVVLVIGRLMMPSTVTWYVNRVIDRSPLYDGRIGGIDIHLWRGAYSIRDIRLNKTTGNVPVPLFAATRVDLAIEWDALLKGKLVGTVRIDDPELNFVDGPSQPGEEDDAGDQTGAGGPWLGMLRDLFPFTINSVRLNNGSVHFRAFTGDRPVDVYLSELSATVDNLTNIHDSTAPLITTVEADALAMDQARFEYRMKLDPFSYRPTFHMATRLLNLDVTKVNELTRAYGAFDFEKGWFDLVIEMDAKEGLMTGYIKPLFRDVQVLSLNKDIKEDNVVAVFWEALVGGAENLLKNQPRDQFGTLIPFRGDVTQPNTDILGTIGNVLRNGFVRAYLPKLQNGGGRDAEGLQFETPSLTESMLINDGAGTD